MNKSHDQGKNLPTCQTAGPAGQEMVWQPPRLTIWELVRDTGEIAPNKIGSGADSRGMRDVTPVT